MEYGKYREVSNKTMLYAPVEPMDAYGTEYMTKNFIKRAVFSDGSSLFRNPPEPEKNSSVALRIRTARGNASAVVLVAGESRFNMEKKETDELFDYYEAVIHVAEDIVEYYFLIWCADRYYYYNSIGVSDEHRPEYNFKIMPGFSTPDWAKGAVIYQIFTDRFCNGDGVNSVLDDEYSYIGKHVKCVLDWNKIPDTDGIREFYGGDLAGVLKKLDYLKELGVEVIYFNPLFVSPSNHKYDIQDYDHIDPHLTPIPYDKGAVLAPGDEDNTHAERFINRVTNYRNLEAANAYFASFVEAAHAHGIRVILDGVFNHCGSFNKWLDRQLIYDKQDGYEHGAYVDKDSNYRSFFRFREYSWPNNTTYEGWWGHDTLPKLNYEESPMLREYIMDIARKWVSPPYNADGWRLDVAADLGFSEEFNHRFWKEFRRNVKEANPEAIIIAENYNDSEKWLRGGEWDTIMNYEAFMEPVTWFFTGMEKHSDESRPDLLNNQDAFFGAMLYHMSRMNTQSLLTAMNELSNHDHSRFLTRTNGKVGRLDSLGGAAASEGINPAVMREAVVVQMTWPGAPCVYYGDEAGVCGWTDPDNRRTYPWGHEDLGMLRFHKEMIGIHKSYEVLRTGSFKLLSGNHGVICFGRFNNTDAVVVAVNNNDYQYTLDIPVWELGISDNIPVVKLAETNSGGYNFNADIYRPETGVVRIMLEPRTAIVMKNMAFYLC